MANRETWDLGRFARTLAYFDTLPLQKVLPCLTRWILGVESASPPSPRQALGSVLVIGADNRLGTIVAEALRSRGYRVWPQLLSELPPNSLNAVIYAGESENSLAAAIATGQRGADSRVALFDFQQPTTDLAAIWGAVDDVVMGGVSESDFYLANGTGLFAGNVSTANSGGFASVRTRNFDPALDLSSAQGFRLRLRGDGKRYKFIARCEGRWDGVAYCYSFDTQPEQWQELEIPFSALTPVFRARTVFDAPPFDASRTHAVQLMLSKFEYDGALNPHFAPGRFELRVATIGTYGGATTAKLIVLGGETEAAAARASGLPYCALKLAPAVRDNPALAPLAIAALERPEACNKTLRVNEAELQGTADWRSLFARAEP